MWKTVKMLALTAIMISVNGCQLLIDNRSRESGAVVVVPSDEWEAMRQASLAASEVAELKETDDTETEMPTVKFEPTPGSEAISFTNYTSASLGGCITSGIIELQHQVPWDAVTLLKNEAFRLSSNQLIVTKMNSALADYASTITIEARMLTCPLRISKRKLTHG